MDFKFSDKTATKVNDRYWTFCVGSGHASLALRSDYQEQLKRAHDELGFERVRFHGVFNDDMKVITRLSDYIPIIPNSKKVKTTSFYHIALVFDKLLEIGIKPFVELGFMPSALAKGKRTVFYYKGNITLPKKREEWVAFIKEFINFLIDRYGKDEIETWYFEVWNEPDLKHFFFEGSQKDYFELYKDTVTAIKNIDDKIIVGGPSTSSNRWLTDMRNYCEAERLPLDFLSTHHYPGDDLGLPMFTKEKLKTILSSAKNGADVHTAINSIVYNAEKLPMIDRKSMVNQAKKAREEAGSVPLIYSEWNVCPSCTAPLHDTAQSASYVIKHTMDCQYIMDACSFWTFSDIFEELTFFTKPFSGSFGLMTVQGIPKPSYWAFYMLNRLGEERFDLPTTHKNIELAAFRKGEKIQLLVYRQNYNEGTEVAETVKIDCSLSKKVSKATVMKIDRTHCNPKALWQEMGEPEYLSNAAVDAIKERTKIAEEQIDFIETENGIIINTALADNDVQLIEIE